MALQSVVEMVGVDQSGGKATAGSAIERCRTVEDPQTGFLFIDMRLDRGDQSIHRFAVVLGGFVAFGQIEQPDAGHGRRGQQG